MRAMGLFVNIRLRYRGTVSTGVINNVLKITGQPAFNFSNYEYIGKKKPDRHWGRTIRLEMPLISLGRHQRQR